MTRWLLVPLALAACHPVSTKDTADDTDRDTDVDSDTPPTDDTDPIQPDDTDPIETDETVPGETDETDESDVRETGGSLPDARALEPGDLVITELMIQPACINDDAEYIEVLYRGAAPIDLIGLSLADAGATWTLATHRATRPGETILLWREPLPGRSQCYGFTQGLAYASPISLSNTGDAVWLDDPDGERIDAVDYRGWTVPFAAALQLDPGHNDAAENDVEASWCASTTPLDPAPDLGTPGAPNPPCPEPPVETGSPGDSDTPDDTDVPVDTDVPASGPLVLSEVVDYGPDPDLRYIEVCNPSDRPVNLLGWSIERYSNGGTTPARIALTGATLLPGDAWVVASTAGDPATWLATFGVEPDQRSGSVSSNGDDAWTLSWDDGAGPAQVDVFGEVGVDGTGAAWEYEDAAAARAQGGPSLVWQAADWVIRGDALAPTPGRCGPPDPLPVDTDETDVPDTAPPPRGIHPGELVINGLLPDPASPCADGDGEWLTFVNVTDETLDLDGLVIADASRSFLYGGALQIAPGAEAVAWPAPGTSECFGLVDGLVYSASVTLNNGGDTVSLAWGGTTVDEVTYPSARSGKARELDPRYTDAAANDDDAWWCDAVTTFSPSVDLGTPGTPNALCDLDTDLPVDSDTPDTDLPDTDLPDTDLPDTDLPDTDRVDTDLPEPVDTVPPRGVHAGELVINGLLANPASPCADEDGEWLTFVNVTDEWLDLDGLVIADASRSFLYGGALQIAPGAEAVAWPAPGTSECFGLVDGLVYSASVTLNNGGDTVSLAWGGTTVDEVTYPSARSGKARELDPRYTDAAANDDDAWWCDAVTTFSPSVDLGTPGTPNALCDLDTDLPVDSDTPDTDLPDTDLPDTDLPDTDLPDTDRVDTDLPEPVDTVPPRGVHAGELVINGLLANPASPCADEDGEWLTFVNVTDEWLDLDGVTLSDPASATTWSALAVPPGAEVIAWRSPRATQCHGFVDGVTWAAGLSLNNSGDTVRLTWAGELIDEVSYPSQGAHDGAAWELDPRRTDAALND
ncbi:MAG TPA: lamin tail domain-containing protein, partial [Myxococcota bacterium]|nr:lamin tail domain-containing protein [Myxococcota bacterium]